MPRRKKRSPLVPYRERSEDDKSVLVKVSYVEREYLKELAYRAGISLQQYCYQLLLPQGVQELPPEPDKYPICLQCGYRHPRRACRVKEPYRPDSWQDIKNDLDQQGSTG